MMLPRFPDFIATLIVVAMVPISSAMGSDEVSLVTLDPGHFHASLVQKFMYPQVNPVVHVYAPDGLDLQEHLKRVNGFNTRADQPTHWQQQVYTGSDFLDRLLQDHSGNVVVISGNNSRKTEYIEKCIEAGFNVLADKPMAISPQGFARLCQAFKQAVREKVLLYDIMTERYEITNLLLRELAREPELFGELQKGTLDNPAVVMESVHYYFKEVAGKPLIRPGWFFDPAQEGEAIPDVGTHLVDLVQWECFPEQGLDWTRDIKVHAARRWATTLTRNQFQRVTGLADFPAFLQPGVRKDGALSVFQNGDVSYALRGVHAKVTALWKFEAPPGAKDTFYSMLRGSRTRLTIKQGAEQNYVPILYAENISTKEAADAFERVLRAAVAKLCHSWPGLDVKPSGQNTWQILIPEKYSVGHEAHFAQVTQRYLDFLAKGEMPSWEVPCMLAKYYTTTEAYRLSHKAK